MELVYIVNVYPYYDLEVFNTYSKASDRLAEIAKGMCWEYFPSSDEYMSHRGEMYYVITKEVK